MQTALAELKSNQNSSDIVLNDAVRQLDDHTQRLVKIETTEIDSMLNTVSKQLVQQTVAELIYPLKQKWDTDFDTLKLSSHQHGSEIGVHTKDVGRIQEQLN